jgi:prefoldin subunit 5
MTNEYVAGLQRKIKGLKKEITYLNRASSKKVERIRRLESEMEGVARRASRVQKKSELLALLAESFLSDIKKIGRSK